MINKNFTAQIKEVEKTLNGFQAPHFSETTKLYTSFYVSEFAENGNRMGITWEYLNELISSRVGLFDGDRNQFVFTNKESRHSGMMEVTIYKK